MPDGLNPVDIGYDAFRAGFETLVLPLVELLDHPPEAVRACMALAGAGSPAVAAECKRIAEKALRGSARSVSVTVLSDVGALVECYLSASDGVVLIAGTGSVCVAVRHVGSKRITSQVGGWGSYLDSGSGFMIGAALLMAALRTLDGRQTETAAVGLLCKSEGIQLEDVPKHFLPPARAKVAALAPVLIRSYEAGDVFARAVVREAVADLVEMAASAADGAGLKTAFPVFASGGLFRSRVITGLLKRRLRRSLPEADLHVILAPLVHILKLAHRPSE
jgi:N-acetylglucosamine kinase-like BadF-type ATPase